MPSQGYQFFYLQPGNLVETVSKTWYPFFLFIKQHFMILDTTFYVLKWMANYVAICVQYMYVFSYAYQSGTYINWYKGSEARIWTQFFSLLSHPGSGINETGSRLHDFHINRCNATKTTTYMSTFFLPICILQYFSFQQTEHKDTSELYYVVKIKGWFKNIKTMQLSNFSDPLHPPMPQQFNSVGFLCLIRF